MSSALDIKPVKGAFRNRKRLGRGIGSGVGKTCGKGQKGQKSRSGASVPAWFEGGQTPIYRRVPKRGFHNKFAQKWNLLNLEKLQSSAGKIMKTVSQGDQIDPDFLRRYGIVNKKDLPIKLIGRPSTPSKGSNKIDLSPLKNLDLIVHGASRSASDLLKKENILLKIISYKKRLSKTQKIKSARNQMKKSQGEKEPVSGNKS